MHLCTTLLQSPRTARVRDESSVLVLQPDAPVRVPALLAAIRIKKLYRPVRINAPLVRPGVNLDLPVRQRNHFVVVFLNNHGGTVRVLPLFGNFRAVGVRGADGTVWEVHLGGTVLEAVLGLAAGSNFEKILDFQN